MVDELLAARGIVVSHETVRQWALKFGQGFANQIRRRLPAVGDKWHLDEVVLTIAGVKHWLWRAVDQNGTVLDILVQSRRDARTAKRLMRKLLKRQCQAPRVVITDKLASYGAANALRRAQEAQGPEQQGGKLAPAYPATRAADEALQISRPGAALLVRPRWDQQPLPPSPPSSARRPVSSRPEPSLPSLGRGHRRHRCGVTTSTPSQSHPIATLVQQVDGARSTPPLWHVDAVGGRPPHQGPPRCLVRIPNLAAVLPDRCLRLWWVPALVGYPPFHC